MYRLPGWRHRQETGVWILRIILCFVLQSAKAQNSSPELIQPPICSAATAGQPALKGICTVTSLGDGRNEVKVNLVAQTARIEVAGYNVTTENYGDYLTPIIEAMPGDTVAAHLVNLLKPRPHDGMPHGDADQNPTNLHYFHGGIVSPNNARPKSAELGNGDNVYVHLKAGQNTDETSSSFDLQVPISGNDSIPTNDALDARVLEGEGHIPHPVGLNWYHSHLHGISSDQVMGGMSGLLSVGEATANVKAACHKDPKDNSRCLNDVKKDTADLRNATKVRYVLLRDLPLKNVGKYPDQADNTTADWDPSSRTLFADTSCGAWKQDGSGLDNDAKLRTGYCQKDPHSAWLFTLNGQRFPTITVEGGRNLLIRLGNLSANVAYWLELYNEADGTVLPLTILSLDGVVPAKPASPEQADKPVEAFKVANVLMMPAMRAEVYIRNDENPHTAPKVYILRTKGLLHIGADEGGREFSWPEIQLGRIVLGPSAIASTIKPGLNASITKVVTSLAAKVLLEENVQLPPGCVRDLDPAFQEFRRVTFINGGQTSSGMQTDWSMKTEIVRPNGSVLQAENKYFPPKPDVTTINATPFEEYVQEDGLVDWRKPHVCIFVDHHTHAGSHKQLWVLGNKTDTLHNFHIHQMKFRLATQKDLAEHLIAPPTPSHSCDPTQDECTQPDYKFYDDQEQSAIDLGAATVWHDTIALPPFSRVYIVMSFDAKQQLGRFVFHCHVLMHEDKGLMAPIEVWEPTPALSSK